MQQGWAAKDSCQTCSATPMSCHTHTTPGRTLCNGHSHALYPTGTLSGQVLKCTSVRACRPSPMQPACCAPRSAAGADSQGKPHCVASQQPCVRQSKVLLFALTTSLKPTYSARPVTCSPLLPVSVDPAHCRSRLKHQHSTQPYRSCERAAPGPAVGADCKSMPHCVM